MIYIKVMTILAAASIVGHFADHFPPLYGLISFIPNYYSEYPNTHEGLLYMFHFQPHIQRNNSIFFEPGAYQFFINIALAILMFDLVKLSNKHKLLLISLFFITLLSTRSTTGFLMFSMTFLGWFLFKYNVKTTAKVIVIGLIGAGVILGNQLVSDVIIKKIEHHTSDIEGLDSPGRRTGERRSFDALIDIELIKQQPFGLGWRDYTTEFSRVGLVRLGSVSSNGITKSAAVYGIPFAIFLYTSYLIFFLKYTDNIAQAMLGFGFLLMFHYGEAAYVTAPICLLFIAAIFIPLPTLDKDQEHE